MNSQRTRIINPIIKDSALFLTTQAESAGKNTLIELELLPGGGNPLHFHTRFSETFTAVEGQLMLKLGKGKSLLLNPGEKFTVKAHQYHCFYNPGKEKITFMIEIVPGDLGFEQFIHILYKMSADGSSNRKGLPKDLKTLSLIMEMGDTHAVGLLSLLNPLVSYLAKKARKEGLDKKLIEKYCWEEYFAERSRVAV